MDSEWIFSGQQKNQWQNGMLRHVQKKYKKKRVVQRAKGSTTFQMLLHDGRNPKGHIFCKGCASRGKKSFLQNSQAVYLPIDEMIWTHNNHDILAVVENITKDLLPFAIQRRGRSFVGQDPIP